MVKASKVENYESIEIQEVDDVFHQILRDL